MSIKEFTPEKIRDLKPNEIFVFGSNIEGQHVGGAARYARDHFGAIWGVGVGPQGQSYAIPTMKGGVESIRLYVDQFIKYAASQTNLKFFVTPIACGIAGFKVSEIAPLFKEALNMENVILPEPFVNILTGNESGNLETRDERQLRLQGVFKDTLEMIDGSDELQKRLSNSIAKTKFYPAKAALQPSKDLGKNAQITVTNYRTYQAARLMSERFPGKRIAVLNFASATNPGGGVLWGSSAQEESLCRCSTLYPVLDRQELHQQYYDFHRNRKDTLYTDACIYSPEVTIIKSDVNHPERLPADQWLDVDVITCAAPNLRYQDISNEEHRNLHLSRNRKILDIALENHVDCLVLGAFGCGAFRNNPSVVAQVYADLLKEYRTAFDAVEFAIFYVNREIQNFEAFKNVFSRF